MTPVNKEFNYLHLSLLRKDFAARGFLRRKRTQGGIENFEINVENFSHIPGLRRWLLSFCTLHIR